MATGTAWKSTKAVFAGLLVTTVLATGGVGCASQVSGRALSDDSEPFITDRVVEVRIVMDEDDWASCQQNALAEQYVRADFWYDGELVSDVAVRPKGNSSLRSAFSSRSPRFSLKVDFNLFNRARTFRGLKKLNFKTAGATPHLSESTSLMSYSLRWVFLFPAHLMLTFG